MKVSELIKKLEKMDQDALVVVDGHSDESNYEDAGDPEEILVYEQIERDWSGKYSSEDNHFNKYGVNKGMACENDKPDPIKCVRISQ